MPWRSPQCPVHRQENHIQETKLAMPAYAAVVAKQKKGKQKTVVDEVVEMMSRGEELGVLESGGLGPSYASHRT